MLEKMTGGVLRSTPHRVRNPSASDRVSFPFFFDPDFEASVSSIVHLSPKLAAIVARRGGSRPAAAKTLTGTGSDGDQDQDAAAGTSASGPAAAATGAAHGGSFVRWDGKRVGLEGPPVRYGDWVMDKISRVFPFLFEQHEMKAANLNLNSKPESAEVQLP